MIKEFKLFIIIFFFIHNLFALSNENKISYINTENISYNESENIVELGDNSYININDTSIYTNKGFLDYKNKRVLLDGNFYLNQDTNILNGTRLDGNFDLTIFETNNVNYIYNNDLKIDSKKLTRNGNKVVFNENFLTPCKIDGYFNCPTWSLKIKETKYLIDEDKFTHYNSFLQIADKKLFYIPYFTHYGSKAPRKSGFLTPTIEFNFIGSDTNLYTPYYIPIGVSADLIITPRLSVDMTNFQLLENLAISSNASGINTGGSYKFDINTSKNKSENNITNTFKFETTQTINKRNNFELKTFFTNSISSARSINNEQLPFENIYAKLNTYDLFIKKDLLTSRIDTVAAFDNSDNNMVPIQVPNITYTNKINLGEGGFLLNFSNFYYSKRNISDAENPKESLSLSINNTYIKSNIFRNFFLNQKAIINNSYKEHMFINNLAENQSYLQSSIMYSAEVDKYVLNNQLNNKFKLIINNELKSNKNINQTSRALTFNYYNLFKENRAFGEDLFDDSKRIVYGIEYHKTFSDLSFNLNLAKSFDFNKNSNYLKKINQKNNFSDYAINSKINFKNIFFDMDSRISHKNLSKQEMNYSLSFSDPLNISLTYNETSKEAYLEHTNDTKSLTASLSNQINENLKLSLASKMDVKEKYQPFENSIKVSIFDECSNLDITYSNVRYSDNYNTTPSETLSLTFIMDYLGFFGYSQSTDLFFKDFGSFDYGL